MVEVDESEGRARLLYLSLSKLIFSVSCRMSVQIKRETHIKHLRHNEHKLLSSIFMSLFSALMSTWCFSSGTEACLQGMWQILSVCACAHIGSAIKSNSSFFLFRVVLFIAMIDNNGSIGERERHTFTQCQRDGGEGMNLLLHFNRNGILWHKQFIIFIKFSLLFYNGFWVLSSLLLMMSSTSWVCGVKKEERTLWHLLGGFYFWFLQICCWNRMRFVQRVL
jgi:hypothetical protein